jgi:hypothetical protein
MSTLLDAKLTGKIRPLRRFSGAQDRVGMEEPRLNLMRILK